MPKKVEDVVKVLPPDKRWEYVCDAAWNLWINVPKVLAEDYGWGYKKASDFLVNFAHRDADKDSQDGLVAQGIKERDATAALRAGMYLMVNMFKKGNFRILEYSPDRCVFEYDWNPNIEVAKRLEVFDKFDLATMDDKWWTKLAANVNPRLKVKFEKRLEWGDPVTRQVIYKE